MDRNFAEKMKNDISLEFYESYCKLMRFYNDAIIFLHDTDPKTYGIFYKWYAEEGEDYFRDVANNILKDKLDNRFVVFMDIYGSYLEDAMEEGCRQVLLDFLYIIPKRMKEDFLKFGFVQDRQEFIWNYHISMDLDSVYECSLEPGRYCQVLLF